MTNSGTLTTPDNGYLTTSRTGPGLTIVNFDSGSLPTNYSGGGIVGPGTSSSDWASPYSDTTKYFSVGPSTSTPGVITANQGNYWDYFGLYWGSLDTYNAIEFLKDGVQVAYYTGQDIQDLGIGVIANGGQYNPSSNVYLNFDAQSSSEWFNKIILTSSDNAFESDNHAFQTVPEPLTILGTGTAIGFGAVFKRQQAKKQQKEKAKA